MSLMHEYGERKEQKGKEEGIKETIISLLESGMSAEEISDRLKEPLENILKIKNKI